MGSRTASAVMPLAHTNTLVSPMLLIHESQALCATKSATRRAQSSANVHARAPHTASAASGGMRSTASTRGADRSRSARVNESITVCMCRGPAADFHFSG